MPPEVTSNPAVVWTSVAIVVAGLILRSVGKAVPQILEWRRQVAKDRQTAIVDTLTADVGWLRKRIAEMAADFEGIRLELAEERAERERAEEYLRAVHQAEIAERDQLIHAHLVWDHVTASRLVRCDPQTPIEPPPPLYPRST